MHLILSLSLCRFWNHHHILGPPIQHCHPWWEILTQKQPTGLTIHPRCYNHPDACSSVSAAVASPPQEHDLLLRTRGLLQLINLFTVYHISTCFLTPASNTMFSYAWPVCCPFCSIFSYQIDVYYCCALVHHPQYNIHLGCKTWEEWDTHEQTISANAHVYVFWLLWFSFIWRTTLGNCRSSSQS